MTVLGALARRESSPQNRVDGWWVSDSSSSTWAGVNVTTTNSLHSSIVYGCVAFIVNGVSTLPLDHLRKGTNGPEEVPTSPSWLRQPTPELDFVSWSGQVLTSLLLAGNAWCYKTYENGRLTGLVPIDPSKVVPDRSTGRLRWVVSGRPYSTMEVLHIPALMFPGADVGLSPVEMAKQTIGAGMAQEEYTSRFFGDDATPPGVIEIPADSTETDLKAMAQAWAKAHAGKSKRRLPGVLQGGATWKQTAVTNEQAQFLQTRKYTAIRVASDVFLIDPSEMGLGVEGQSLTYSNMEERAIRRVQVTFQPWIVRLERALTNLLPRPQYVKLNVNAVLRGDTKTRFEAYQLGIKNRFITPNEAREFEDWQDLPDGDQWPPTTSAPAPQEAP